MSASIFFLSIFRGKVKVLEDTKQKNRKDHGNSVRSGSNYKLYNRLIFEKGATFVLRTFELITEFPMPIGRLYELLML